MLMYPEIFYIGTPTPKIEVPLWMIRVSTSSFVYVTRF